MIIHLTFSAFVILFQIGCAMPSSLGVSCHEHPGYFEGLKPVLVKSWEVLSGILTLPGMYHIGYDGHRFAPVNNADSMEYDRLDWFWAVKGGPSREKHLKLSLTRSAKIYMLVPFNARLSGRNPRLPGWTSEGAVKLVKGIGKPLEYGVHQTGKRYISGSMYMFSRPTGSEVLLPNMKWVQRAARGIRVTGDWIVMVAEADGTAPVLQYPSNPAGVTDRIIPNARCPTQLHDLWLTRSTDESDEDTKGMMWKTWHPQWDPCYWCGYDHEHGSSPKDLMGYEPKFHYTAWKNGQEKESHEGYKGYVFRYQAFFVYFMVHMQTSNMKRVSTRHHTILLAVSDARTKELLMEITHKADFGFIGVKGKRGRVFPLSVDEKRLHDAQMSEGTIQKMRSINVIDFAKLNPYYMYRTPKRDMRRGVYETWTTVPLCSANNKLGVVNFDVTAAATGIKTAATRQAKVLTLGYRKDGKSYRQTGAPRILRLKGFSAGDDHCSFKLRNVYGRRRPDGSFYTDAYGTSLHDGPSARTIRQYVKPGFNMKISGKFAAVESWTGLYRKNSLSFIANYGFSIDPDKN